MVLVFFPVGLKNKKGLLIANIQSDFKVFLSILASGENLV